MATKNATKLKFDNLVKGYKDAFPFYQVLDPSGKVVDRGLEPNMSDEQLTELMRRLVWARTYDRRVTLLNRQGALGNYAPGGGQEASQVASQYALGEGDFFAGTYRDLVPLIMHGLPVEKAFLWYKGHMDGNNYPEDLHAYSPQVIVGGHITHAMGVALGMKKRNKKNVVLSLNGDGATSQGDFYEGINFAGVYEVPYIAVVQNNGYGISVPVEQQTQAETLAQKAVAAGIPGIQVDGMDPLAMYAVVSYAREHALAGKGPVLIEALTYRFGPHTMSDDPTRYRSEEELTDWERKDPLHRMRKYLGDKGLWNEEKENEVVEACTEEIKQAVAAIGQADKQKISDFLKNMYEVSPQNIQEQIAEYEAKEMTDHE
ncbi:pyruvate dehydrogenase (acetyl-transferring) E1 component subunit alpha [Pontibacillus litoralis]|uniref:Pyruvate dehydrogenase E1 component subunit alpha n=1 Tax=Pontibacillus litoralis JSM 072002 TaxID=1385512 RepID=A0A0A5G9G5_9BACI|nr:pyruvate dehydrogenase (acetyl-transferring) E1 component subunit alpha [Pontibacillus litoralis]KGX87755.1 pyruvate dehydrogenase E1 subunit alpha [Pontibacillus litoralis JSM 072002]